MLAVGAKASIPIYGGTAFVLPIVPLFPISLSSTGTISLPIIIPNDPTLKGINLNMQSAFFDSAAQMGVSLTNGVEGWIG